MDYCQLRGVQPRSWRIPIKGVLVLYEWMSKHTYDPGYLFIYTLRSLFIYKTLLFHDPSEYDSISYNCSVLRITSFRAFIIIITIRNRELHGGRNLRTCVAFPSVRSHTYRSVFFNSLLYCTDIPLSSLHYQSIMITKYLYLTSLYMIEYWTLTSLV